MNKGESKCDYYLLLTDFSLFVEISSPFDEKKSQET